MRTEKTREFLQGRGVPDDTIDAQMAIVGDFVKFLTDLGVEAATTAGKEEVGRFARELIAEGRNTLENFSLLRDYAGWLGRRPLYVALIELADCHNAIEVLADEIGKGHGQEVRERVFREALPPLGADEKERCAHTRMITERMAQQITPEEARAAWYQVQHGISADRWRQSDLANREKFEQCGSIDGFLDLKRRERDALLTRLRDEDKLWYTVEITDEVLAFVKSDPEMEVGRREGDRIYISKIPYNAVRYLHETDAQVEALLCLSLPSATRGDTSGSAGLRGCLSLQPGPCQPLSGGTGHGAQGGGPRERRQGRYPMPVCVLSA